MRCFADDAMGVRNRPHRSSRCELLVFTYSSWICKRCLLRGEGRLGNDTLDSGCLVGSSTRLTVLRPSLDPREFRLGMFTLLLSLLLIEVVIGGRDGGEDVFSTCSEGNQSR